MNIKHSICTLLCTLGCIGFVMQIPLCFAQETQTSVFRMPLRSTVDWGTMTSAEEWERSYEEYADSERISLPQYNISRLTTPLLALITRRNATNSSLLTEKLTYSTRHLSSYDLDSSEYTGTHVGIDIKAPLNTPVFAIGNGIVHAVSEDERYGKYIITEHTYYDEHAYAIYAHLQNISVHTGETINAHSLLGTVGMTGRTTAPHLHFQIDRERGLSVHIPFTTMDILRKEESEVFTLHPIEFIAHLSSHASLMPQNEDFDHQR